MSKTNVVKKEEKENLPAVVNELELLEHAAGMGMEQVSQQDVATPFLKILQALSAQVKKSKPAEYVEGAEEGMIYNTVSKKIYNGADGILVVPCAFQKRFVEWKPNLGGFVRDYGTDSSVYDKCDVNARGIRVTKEGNEIIAYATFFVLLLSPDGTYEHAIMSMTSTQFKHSRNWLAQMRQIMLKNSKGEVFNPPMFYKAYRAKTVPESNDQQDWFGWSIKDESETLKLPNGVALFKAAEAFSKLVIAGDVKVAPPEEPSASGAGDDASSDAF